MQKVLLPRGLELWIKKLEVLYHRVQRRMISVDIFFVFLRLLFLALLLLYET